MHRVKQKKRQKKLNDVDDEWVMVKFHMTFFSFIIKSQKKRIGDWNIWSDSHEKEEKLHNMQTLRIYDISICW